MTRKTKPKAEVKKNPVGRPSELAESLIMAEKYLNGGYEDVGELVPTVAGMACFMKKRRDTMYEYAKKSKEFSDILEGVLAIQEVKLISRSLDGTFNSTITKLLMTKHGYSDKIEQDNTSSDGSMTPKAPIYTIVNE